MYENEDNEIYIWCDGKDVTRKRKQSEDASPEATASKRFCSHESNVEELAQDLAGIHGDKFNYAQYKLWARMIINKQHTDKNIPPNICMIMGKKTRKISAIPLQIVLLL